MSTVIENVLIKNKKKRILVLEWVKEECGENQNGQLWRGQLQREGGASERWMRQREK